MLIEVAESTECCRYSRLPRGQHALGRARRYAWPPYLQVSRFSSGPFVVLHLGEQSGCVGVLVSEMQTRIGRIMCETEAQHRNFQSRLRRLRLDRSGVVDGQRTCRLCGALPSSRARPSPKAQDARRRCKPLKSCSRYAGGAGLTAQSEHFEGAGAP